MVFPSCESFLESVKYPRLLLEPEYRSVIGVAGKWQFLCSQRKEAALPTREKNGKTRLRGSAVNHHWRGLPLEQNPEAQGEVELHRK